MKRRISILLVALLLTACGAEDSSPESYTEEQVESAYDVSSEEMINIPSESEQDLWREGYLKYLEHTEFSESDYKYGFVYIDDDDIPELVLDSGFEAGGYIILTYHNGLVSDLQTNRLCFSYCERQNLLNNYGGHQGYYFDYVYQIVDGRWEQIFKGEYSAENSDALIYDEETGRFHAEKYTVAGVETDELGYYAKLSEVYDESKAVFPETMLIYDEVYSYLETGKYLSADNRYELIIEDCTWLEAKQRCTDKGGYLATLTCPEEFEKVGQIIRTEGKENICFYIGASRASFINATGYPQMGIYWNESKLIDPSCIGKWAEEEPSFKGVLSDGSEVLEDFVAIELDMDMDAFFMKDSPNSIAKYYPEYTGRIGYICEFDSKESATADINNELLHPYFMENRSVDQIVEECNGLLDYVLSPEQPDEDYLNCLKVKPTSSEPINDGLGMKYKFIPVAGNVYSCNPGMDIISVIDVTRGVNAPGYDQWKPMGVHIVLCLTDQDKAVQLYEKFYEQIAPLYENSTEIRNNALWSSSGILWNADHSISLGVPIVYLEESHGYYVINVSKYHDVG